MTYEEKLNQAKKFLGKKYVLHPVNRVRKLREPQDAQAPLILDARRHSYDPHKQGQ